MGAVRQSQPRFLLRRPLPVADFRHILTVAGDVLLVLDQLVARQLPEVSPFVAQLRNTVDRVHHQMKAIEVIEHRHVKGGGGGAFLFVTTHVKIFMIGAAVSQAMNEPGIAVISKNDWLAGCEERIKVSDPTSPCGCSSFGCSVIRSTTLITRTLSSGT